MSGDDFMKQFKVLANDQPETITATPASSAGGDDFRDQFSDQASAATTASSSSDSKADSSDDPFMSQFGVSSEPAAAGATFNDDESDFFGQFDASPTSTDGFNGDYNSDLSSRYGSFGDHTTSTSLPHESFLVDFNAHYATYTPSKWCESLSTFHSTIYEPSSASLNTEPDVVSYIRLVCDALLKSLEQGNNWRALRDENEGAFHINISPAKLNAMSQAQLKAELKSRGLATSGLKAVQKQRLVAYQAERAEPKEAASDAFAVEEVASIVHVLARMQYRDEKLLNALDQRIRVILHGSVDKPAVIAAICWSAAALHYEPSEDFVDAVVDYMMTRVSQTTLENNMAETSMVCLALSTLGSADSAQLGALFGFLDTFAARWLAQITDEGEWSGFLEGAAPIVHYATALNNVQSLGGAEFVDGLLESGPGVMREEAFAQLLERANVLLPDHWAGAQVKAAEATTSEDDEAFDSAGADDLDDDFFSQFSASPPAADSGGASGGSADGDDFMNQFK
jgi:hypothetical protein